MNIYDVLRKLVEARPWADLERTEAIDLLNELESVNALGTLSGKLDKRDHDHERAGQWFPESMKCVTCRIGMDPPSHACIPGEVGVGAQSWRGGYYRTETRCKICNREME